MDKSVHSYDVWTCGDPKCLCVHLIFKDKSGNLMFQAVIPREGVEKMLAAIDEKKIV